MAKRRRGKGKSDDVAGYGAGCAEGAVIFGQGNASYRHSDAGGFGGAANLQPFEPESSMSLRQIWAILAAVPLSIATPSVDAHAAERLLPLRSGEIEKALVGKLILYNPDMMDAGIHEEFHPGGVWRGILYGRGPISFSGRWSIVGDRICVQADKGTHAEHWHAGLYCRQVWQNPETGALLIDHLSDRPDSPYKKGLQVLVIRDLPTSK